MKAWDAFLKSLEQKLGSDVVDKWLRSLKVIDFDACNLYLESENSFQIDWFNEHIRKIAQKSFRNENHHLIKIHFKGEKKKRKNRKTPSAPEPSFIIESDQIDPLFTFSNFIVREENNFVFKVLKELKPGFYNPIFLHGPEGSGKTHLLCALANALKNLKLSTFYVHAETLTHHVVTAIRSSHMQDFRRVYRNKDVLIIDDVHHLARRSATQEELFHTFNTLHTAGKQIILSSHLATNLLTEIEPRLISRFEWGILLKLEPLPPAALKELLLDQAKIYGFPLNDLAAQFLIETFGPKSKPILVAFEALMMRHKYSTPPSGSDVKQLLKDLIAKQKKNLLSLEKIVASTASYFGMRPEDILGKSQTKECVIPRKIAMYLCREKLQLTYPAIGRHFQRDHSTVMANIKQVEKKKTLAEIETALKGIESTLIESAYHRKD